MSKSKTKNAEPKPVNLGRHESQCLLCQHPQREDIEREWIDWGNTSRLAEEYGLSRDSLYRHMHAMGLVGLVFPPYGISPIEIVSHPNDLILFSSFRVIAS